MDFRGRSLIKVVIGACFFSTALILFAGCKGKAYPVLHGTWVAPPVSLAPFTLLTDADPLESDVFNGKVVVLAFGYTHCPDACPTTMARLAKSMQMLGEAAEEVQVVLLSVDPERDTPELMGRYVATFNPTFIGGSVDTTDEARLFETLGIFSERAEEATGDAQAYLVDHTTSTIVLDRSGNWQMVWNFSVTAEQMTEDLQTLIAR